MCRKNKSTGNKYYVGRLIFFPSHLLSHHFSYTSSPLRVVVEEIAVQQCLYGACDPANPVAIELLRNVTSDPVGNVECSVRSKQNNIVRSQVFDLLIPLEHYNLRHDAHRLQVKRKRPEVLHLTQHVRNTSRMKLFDLRWKNRARMAAGRIAH